MATQPTTRRSADVGKPPRRFVRSGRPLDGDVVVASELAPTVCYAVRQVPGASQFSTSVRGEAVRLARGTAAKHAVDLWYCDGQSYFLLEHFRRDTELAS